MTRAPIDEQRLRAALAPRWPRLDVVTETGSTNADLLAEQDAPDRSVLVAEHQRAGKGRLDRRWSFPARAGLAFSALLRPGVPVPTWGWLSLLAGVALHEAVGDLAGIPVALKWPNDLLAGTPQRKLAGILAHTSGAAVVVGIGLNVSLTEDELPVPTATSLQLCNATSLDRTELLIGILTRLDSWLGRWEGSAGDAAACGLAAAYHSACATIGQLVTVTAIDGAALTGTATGLAADGRLRVLVNGAERVIGAGDVEHLRPA